MINIIYNNDVEHAPKTGALRPAKRWAAKFKEKGIETIVRPFSLVLNAEFLKRGIDLNHYLVVYDDQQPNKYLTEELDMPLEDMISYFRPRKERSIEMKILLERLYAGQKKERVYQKRKKIT